MDLKLTPFPSLSRATCRTVTEEHDGNYETWCNLQYLEYWINSMGSRITLDSVLLPKWGTSEWKVSLIFLLSVSSELPLLGITEKEGKVSPQASPSPDQQEL
ncbi:hypothetical protein QQP08_016917, partial [Theobroma cacao]